MHVEAAFCADASYRSASPRGPFPHVLKPVRLSDSVSPRIIMPKVLVSNTLRERLRARQVARGPRVRVVTQEVDS